jgi:ABC-type lipoprotein export system ATPase subunit
MALRLAMTLLSKEKSGHAFQTAYADELDGALDPDNSLNFVNMYRSFMTVGGFSDFLFISHKPSCRSMADHILTFEPGKNPEWK